MNEYNILVTISKTIPHVHSPNSEVGLIPCKSIALIAGQRVPLTKSVTVLVTASSPALLYSLLRSSSISTNLAGNQPVVQKRLRKL